MKLLAALRSAERTKSQTSLGIILADETLLEQAQRRVALLLNPTGFAREVI
ncbi:MAG TPA: hypothetical protein VFY67_14270 [Pyrinomonadaceae bacterium]|nr:hypothetical protein [Pyrinomonadaceae bacterium]